jgi:hypothetical protein
MKTSHEIRNWLHYLILAAQAADYEGVASCFARQHPLDIQGPRPEDRWYNWDAWLYFLGNSLGTMRIGNLHLRLVLRPEILLDDELATEANLHWQMAYRLVDPPTQPTVLDCQATLVMENQRWVACSLACSALAQPSDRSE